MSSITEKVGWCVGYLQAVIDGGFRKETEFVIFSKLGVTFSGPENERQAAASLLRGFYCIPTNVTVLQVARVVVKYLRDHPEADQKFREYPDSGFVQIFEAGEMDDHLRIKFCMITRPALLTRHNDLRVLESSITTPLGTLPVPSLTRSAKFRRLISGRMVNFDHSPKSCFGIGKSA